MIEKGDWNMAHSCPECYQTCHCGGDIDDIIFEGEYEDNCTHCAEGDGEDNDYDLL